MQKGIDISSHNGNIDFQKIKENVKFVIIRSSWGYFQEDNMVYQNVQKCEQANLPYGFYHYSYAVNLEEAKKEVDGLLNLIQNFKPTYPIIIDMEDIDNWKEKNGNPSNAVYVSICEYFCKRVEESGYYAMIYANYDWWVNRLNDKRLDRFDKWLADWRGYDKPSLPCGIWQYTSSDTINGITGNVDANISYKDYPTLIKNLKKNDTVLPKEEDGRSPNLP